ncbi:MAG: MFS transporter [Clostridia bacterium]|nr:MFS transporter [Clostridia bacterium]
MYNKEIRNINIYKTYAIFNQLIILGPIITLFFIAKGLSFTEIFLLNSASAFTTVLFEVPTGAVSDYFSKKICLTIGSLLIVLSLLIYVIAPNFYIMVLGEIVFAIGLTFRSGTEQAILYDSLKNNEIESEYTKIEGRARSYTFYAQAVGSILAGFLYEINIYLPFLFSAGFVLVAAVISIFFIEPQIEKKAHETHKYHHQIVESFKFTFKNKRVFSIVLFSLVFTLFYRIGFNYFQPYMKAVHIQERYFGIIFFFFNIVAAFASKHADGFIKVTKPRSLFMLSTLIVVSMMFMSIIHNFMGVIFIFLQQMARGYKLPVFQKYINKRIPSDKRSTILSIQNFANSIVVGVFGPLAGLLLDHTNIFISHFVMSISMAILLVVANIYMISTSKDIELTQLKK